MCDSGLLERIKKAYKYLYANGNVDSITDLADKMKRSRSSVSRAMNGDQSYLNEKFVTAFCRAFPGVLSAEWIMTGDGDMNPASDDLKPSASVIDASSATNAAIAAYVELTNRLKQEMAERLEDKETIIREKDARIIALERTIADRDARIIALERQIAAYHADDLSNYPFSVGVADKLVPQNNKKF